MSGLHVRWAIDYEESDFDADDGNPIIAAAKEAMTMIRDPHGIAHVFIVEDDLGSCYKVDLDENPPTAVPITPF